MKKITLLIILLSGFFTNAQRFNWVATAGGTNSSNGAIAIARDSQGNIYALDGGNEAQQSQGVIVNPFTSGKNIFLYKFNSLGEIIYIKPIGTNFTPLNVVVGDNDNVYVLGALTGTSSIQIGSDFITDTENRNYIFKLDPDGNVMWRAKNTTSYGAHELSTMLLFANNHLYFQSGPLSVRKLNTDGQIAATLTANSFTSATAVTSIFFKGAGVLSNGDLVFSASSRGTVTYGGTTLVPTGNQFIETAMLTIRTTENLNLAWATYTNGLLEPAFKTIPMAVGNDNGIYLGIQVLSTLTAGSDTITNEATGGSTVGGILKIDADGNKIWLKSTTNNVQTWSLLNNPDGTGIFCGGQIFGFQPISLGSTSVNPANGNSFITKIDYSGVFQNSFAFSKGPIGSHVRSLTTDNSGGFYVGGKLNNNTSPVFSCVSRQGNNGLYLGKFIEEPDTAPSPSITVNGNTLTAAPAFSGTIQWFLNDQPINDANSPNYTATAIGNYSVSYSYVSACQSVSAKTNILTLGISDNIMNDEIIVYPNPSTGIFNIQNNQFDGNTSIYVFDLNGRILHQSETENSEIIKLNLNNLQNGIYILKIEIENVTYSQKIIKQ